VPIDATFNPLPLPYHQLTVRNVIAPHIAGDKVRLHLTNRYNAAPVTFARVSIGNSTPHGGVDSPVPVLFGGEASVTIRPGRDAVSDPLPLAVEPFTPLAVSIYVQGPTPQVTKHWNSNATTFIGTGDLTESTSGAGFPMRVHSWLGVIALDVETNDSNRTIVALGDSLTDGWVAASTAPVLDPRVADTNSRYPDYLQRRINDEGLPLSVVNAGLSSNQVLGSIVAMAGPSAIDRFEADVTYPASARGVIIFEGINDLGLSHATAPAVIRGLRELIAKARAADLMVWLATITPASDAIVDGVLLAPNSERDRQRINEWIRTQTEADGYFDFDLAVRDASNPAVLDTRYSSPDRLHFSPAGYERLAEVVDLSELIETTC
jgi:lysophospholipase L1-like esterase